jgi:hypothetical protein
MSYTWIHFILILREKEIWTQNCKLYWADELINQDLSVLSICFQYIVWL